MNGAGCTCFMKNNLVKKDGLFQGIGIFKTVPEFMVNFDSYLSNTIINRIVILKSLERFLERFLKRPSSLTV